MIEALATVASVAAEAGVTPRPPLPGEPSTPRKAAADRNSDAERASETRRVAEQQKQAEGRYQVRIHAETMRVITEIVDMVTGDTLMYLPAGYRPNAKPAAETPPGGRTGTEP